MYVYYFKEKSKVADQPNNALSETRAILHIWIKNCSNDETKIGLDYANDWLGSWKDERNIFYLLEGLPESFTALKISVNHM